MDVVIDGRRCLEAVGRMDQGMKRDFFYIYYLYYMMKNILKYFFGIMKKGCIQGIQPLSELLSGAKNAGIFGRRV